MNNENINIDDSTITPVMTFRRLVYMCMQKLTNFPYIERDFDALTDYELLCKIVEYLNNVIENSNEQNESITNLLNAFLELQTYVNNTKDELETAFNNLNDYVENYFENLDVQEEINNKIDDMIEDGTFAELLQAFTGGYIFVDAIPDIVKYDTKQDALDNYATSRNSEILTPYIRENKGIIFGNGYYPFENYIPLSTDIEMYSIGGNGNLIFPNSDGIVFDRTGYFQDMHIHHLHIESKDYCINFKNDDVTYPNNVYDSKFEFLRLKSYEKTCVYAGDNINSSNDGQLTFHLDFDHIRVSAHDYGFYGLGQLDTVFNEITDYDTIDVVFYNCWGIFTNCNTTYAHANWFLFCDDDIATYYNYSFIFKNCNFEDFKKGIMYFNKTSSGIKQLTISNCTAYIQAEDGVILSRHPLTFLTSNIKNIDFRGFNGIAFKDGKTWTDVYNMANTTLCVKVLTSDDLKSCLGEFTVLFTNNSTVHDINLFRVRYASQVGNSNPAVQVYKELKSDAFDGGRVRKYYTLDLSESRNVNLRNNPVIYDGIILTNASADTNFQYIYPNNIGQTNQNGMLFTIINSSGHNVTLNATTGYQQNYVFLDNGSSKVLANGDTMCCCLIMMGNIAWLKELFTVSAT